MAVEVEGLSPDGGESPKFEGFHEPESDRSRLASSNAPILAWDSVIRILADADPISAAAIAGVVMVIILTVFGRVGSLVVGVLAGLLLHATIEKRNAHDPWQRLSNYTETELAVQQDVWFRVFVLTLGTPSRYHTTKDQHGTPLFLGSCDSRLSGFMVQSSFARRRVSLCMSPFP
jgi:hypothetical protein